MAMSVCGGPIYFLIIFICLWVLADQSMITLCWLCDLIGCQVHCVSTNQWSFCVFSMIWLAVKCSLIYCLNFAHESCFRLLVVFLSNYLECLCWWNNECILMNSLYRYSNYRTYQFVHFTSGRSFVELWPSFVTHISLRCSFVHITYSLKLLINAGGRGVC